MHMVVHIMNNRPPCAFAYVCAGRFFMYAHIKSGALTETVPDAVSDRIYMHTKPRPAENAERGYVYDVYSGYVYIRLCTVCVA